MRAEPLVVELLSSNQKASRLAARLLTWSQALLVPRRWMKKCFSAGPPHGDSAAVQLYKEAANLSLPPRRRWPGCSALPASWSAAPRCCRAKLQVSTPELVSGESAAVLRFH